MTKPAQVHLRQKGITGGILTLLKTLHIGELSLPNDTMVPYDALQLDGFKFALLMSIESPGLPAINYCCWYVNLINFYIYE